MGRQQHIAKRSCILFQWVAQPLRRQNRPNIINGMHAYLPSLRDITTSNQDRQTDMQNRLPQGDQISKGSFTPKKNNAEAQKRKITIKAVWWTVRRLVSNLGQG